MPKINVDMPDDVRKHVLRFQAELKIRKCLSQYSLQSTIYTIVREHEQLLRQKNNITK